MSQYNILANGQARLAEMRQELPAAPRPIAAISPLDDPRTLVDAPALPRRLERVTLATLDTSHSKVAQAVKMARAWAARRREGYQDASLVLCGNNGVGKSHVARAIWWSIVQEAVGLPGTEQPIGLFKMTNDWIGLLGQSQDNETGLVYPARASVIVGRAPLIVIDDVGAEQVIPYIKGDDESQAVEREARLFKLIDHCYTAQISVIVTSNLTIKKLADRLGRRSWDRLVQMAPRLANGDSFMVEMFDVPSYRLKASGR